MPADIDIRQPEDRGERLLAPPSDDNRGRRPRAGRYQRAFRLRAWRVGQRLISVLPPRIL